jgi:hypothetical protein
MIVFRLVGTKIAQFALPYKKNNGNQVVAENKLMLQDSRWMTTNQLN